MDNRYNTELVERFRKGEFILAFPCKNKTQQDVKDLNEMVAFFITFAL